MHVCEKRGKQDCQRDGSANIGQSLTSSLKINAKLQTVLCTLGETLNDQIKALFKAGLKYNYKGALSWSFSQIGSSRYVIVWSQFYKDL